MSDIIFNNHKYTYSKPFGNPRHHWELIGPEGALHFHAMLYPMHDDISDSCGLEVHYFKPPEYMKDRAPSHVDCWLTGGKCWHDGTSLYATDTLWPVIKSFLGASDHESIFNVLENEYVKRFRRGDE